MAEWCFLRSGCGRWAVYVLGNAVLEAHQDETRGYDTSGEGTIRFPWHRPLPVALVTKLVKARIAAHASH
jgi:uncharacterized protein YdhG (YjbR/CyaY superfamily)